MIILRDIHKSTDPIVSNFREHVDRGMTANNVSKPGVKRAPTDTISKKRVVCEDFIQV